MHDPFRDLELGDDFVHRAAIWEPSAAERQAAVAPPPPPPFVPPGPRRRRDRGRWAVVAGVACLIGFSAAQDRGDGDPVALRDTARPPAGVDAASAPLGVPPVVRAAGRYEFMLRQRDGDPVAYDPCRPIQVVVNDRRAVPEAEMLLDRALADVSAATGLRFTIVGSTTEAPGDDRPLYQPERYGERWAPVLVAWSDAEEYPALGADVAGLGGSQAVVDPDSGDFVYVTGSIAIDGDDATWMTPLEVLSTLRHELGHLVGLDHVEDPSQLMHESSYAALEFATGDRAGLAALGGGDCRPGV